MSSNRGLNNINCTASQKTIPSTHRARTSRKPEADGLQIDEKMITTGDIDDELEDFDLQGTI